mmetsp:Transcript_7510/g.15168  ORF Transcript_7510/g.15168 Transcript_7510/m.15168 type:complete len:255 (+) Transcript_7510:197-961(+)|eukprot:CAMPEP_0170394578 /NCGR_PEP_ID=MMETSP0117_2-20130122/21329_1 /TAXON_ID=400756 /ORGANISM="Durinskia baltica, Strain CSIRO CS-38" /LENGTH=254 /DNA_ID=CAMNT_0010650849 /DNA_START=149 /DNA_END=913 /DNA_ORIENTATION=-
MLSRKNGKSNVQISPGAVTVKKVTDIKNRITTILKEEIGLEEEFGEFFHYSFRLSDESTITDVTALESISVEDIKEIEVDCSHTSATFSFQVTDTEYAKEHSMLLRHRIRSHSTTIRSFLELARGHIWNKYGALFIGAHAGGVTRASGVGATDQLNPGNCRPTEWSIFLHAIALDVKAANPGFDTSVLERLQGGKGSTYQQISTDVVHRICHSSFYDEISEHAELSSDQAVGAIEQAQFEALYSDIYGSFTSPT